MKRGGGGIPATARNSARPRGFVGFCEEAPLMKGPGIRGGKMRRPELPMQIQSRNCDCNGLRWERISELIRQAFPAKCTPASPRSSLKEMRPNVPIACFPWLSFPG
jgi:hypothetical protein